MSKTPYLNDRQKVFDDRRSGPHWSPKVDRGSARTGPG